MLRFRLTLFLLVVVLNSCPVFALQIHLINNNIWKDLSPLDYGLEKAESGEERYKVLLKTHKAAVAAGVNVDYSGINEIELEIPKGSPRIPLTKTNDFKGCIFRIRNNTQKSWLFSAYANRIPINIDKSLIDKGDFRSVPELESASYLLLIEDKSPWVQNRRGRDYGHQRKDVLLLRNGMAQNSVIMPYNNDMSVPVCSYIKVEEVPLVIRNITVYRDSLCKQVTNIFYISGYDNVQLSDIEIFTPKNALSGDNAIRIYDSTNVTMRNILINGTYSQENQSGYGISLLNVWNYKAYNISGKGNWGIFGTNNMNTVSIYDSDINRFDIHCYGKDCYFENVNFSDVNNQFGSVFGSIIFNNCSFTNFTPLVNRASYYSYVPYDIYLNHCVFNVTKSKRYLFHMGEVSDDVNVRRELSRKCWPNIYIKELTVNIPGEVDEFGIITSKVIGKPKTQFDYISKIQIKGLTINVSPETILKRILLCKYKVNLSKALELILDNINIQNPSGFNLVEAKHMRPDFIVNLPIDKKRINTTALGSVELNNNSK